MSTHHSATVASTLSRLLPVVKTSVCALLAVLLCTACDTAKSRLAAAVKAQNANCPQEIDGGELTSVEMDGNDVVFTYTYNDQNMYIINMMHSAGTLNEFIKSTAATTVLNEETKDFFTLPLEADAGMRFEIKGYGDDESISVSLTKDEIKEIAANDKPSANATLAMIKGISKAMNKTCPLEVDPVTIIESMDVIGDSMLVYNYIINEEQIEMSIGDLPIDEFKATYEDDIKSPYGQMRTVANACTKCNVGLRYHYKGSSTGQTADITFTADELHQLIR